MVLWNFDLLWKNYGTMAKTMVLYRELWNYDLRRGKHCRLPKTKKLSFINEKLKVIKQKSWSFWTNL